MGWSMPGDVTARHSPVEATRRGAEAADQARGEAIEDVDVGRREADLGLHDVRQLADVARPVVAPELVEHLGPEVAHALALLLGEAEEEVRREGRMSSCRSRSGGSSIASTRSR